MIYLMLKKITQVNYPNVLQNILNSLLAIWITIQNECWCRRNVCMKQINREDEPVKWLLGRAILSLCVMLSLVFCWKRDNILKINILCYVKSACLEFNVVPTGSAPNNITIMYKHHYIKELGISTMSNNAYMDSVLTAEEVCQNHVLMLSDVIFLKKPEDMYSPLLTWIPKLYYWVQQMNYQIPVSKINQNP